MSIYILVTCGQNPVAYEDKATAFNEAVAFTLRTGWYAEVHFDGDRILSATTQEDGRLKVVRAVYLDPETLQDAGDTDRVIANCLT
jgi:hypothetical protein